MLDIQSSKTTPYYAFEHHDEVVVNDISYRPIERRPGGYIFQRTDSKGVAEFFDNGKLSHLVQKGLLNHKVAAFSPEIARRRLADASLPSIRHPDVPFRCKLRHAYVEAFHVLEAQGKVKRTDASITRAMPELRSKAGKILGLSLASDVHGEQVETIPKEKSPTAIRRWLKNYETLGIVGVHDALSRSGNRERRMGLEELAVMMPIIQTYAQKRTTQKIIFEDIENAFEAENIVRQSEGLSQLEMPSRETVRQKILKLDRFQVYVAHHGEEAARKKFAPVTTGLQTTRPLERVEIDEWKIDLMSIFAENDVLDDLTEEEKKALGFGKKKFRWWVTVAICTTTRCILAMRLSRAPSAQSTLQTIEMILRDKGVLTDAFSAISEWNMAGVPEEIVTDCGSAFIPYEVREAMQILGTRGEYGPAGMPEMRARIERFFGTVISSLLPRLSGRTFSSIAEKGDADPEASAALSTEDLSEALVRWVVDVYHNRAHEGLGGETPANCWARLSKDYPVRPAPDLRTRRHIFGTRDARSVSKKGIRILGAWYHCPRLASWWMHSRTNEVQVKLYPGDIGAIEVFIDGTWVEVPAVFQDLKGVTAQSWIATVKVLRASHLHSAEAKRSVVRQTLKDIETLNKNAVKREGLVVHDFSPESLAKLETRLMITFDVADEEESFGDQPGEIEVGWGTHLATAGKNLNLTSELPLSPHETSTSVGQFVTAPSLQAPLKTSSNAEEREGVGQWSSERK